MWKVLGISSSRQKMNFVFQGVSSRHKFFLIVSLLFHGLVKSLTDQFERIPPSNAEWVARGDGHRRLLKVREYLILVLRVSFLSCASDFAGASLSRLMDWDWKAGQWWSCCNCPTSTHTPQFPSTHTCLVLPPPAPVANLPAPGLLQRPLSPGYLGSLLEVVARLHPIACHFCDGCKVHCATRLHVLAMEQHMGLGHK